MGEFEGLPDLLVVVLLEWVEVDPERAGEEDRVLRDDRQLLAQVVQP